MRHFVLLLAFLFGIGRAADGQRTADSATVSQLLAQLREARTTSDSLARYQAIVTAADSVLKVHPTDRAVSQIRLVALAPTINADLRKIGRIASCEIVREWKAALRAYRDATDIGAACENCAQTAAQLRMAKLKVDSLVRANCL